MVVFVFDVPAQADAIEDLCGRHIEIAAEVKALSLGLFEGLFFGREAFDLNDRVDAGAVDLDGVYGDEAYLAVVDASVAQLDGCVQKGGAS